MSSVLTLAVKELETREGLKLEIRSQANCGGLSWVLTLAVKQLKIIDTEWPLRMLLGSQRMGCSSSH
jgi:hypothetical protein